MGNGYTIRTVSQLSGVTEHVIRAWEKRYGVVVPRRTAGNHRVFTESDVVRLRLLARAVDSGNAIGEVHALSNLELKELVEGGSNDGAGTARSLVQRGLDAAVAFDPCELRRVLFDAEGEFGVAGAIEGVISPLMDEIGRAWFEGSLMIIHEHLASGVIRSFLGAVFEARTETIHRGAVVVTAPAGQDHEFGALACAIVASDAGFRVVYLGANVPATGIIQAAVNTNATATIVSVVFPQSMPRVRETIELLERDLSGKTRLLVGGASAIQLGTQYNLRTLDDLTRELASLSNEP